MKKIVALGVLLFFSLPVFSATGPSVTYAFEAKCPADKPFVKSGEVQVGRCSKDVKTGKEECEVQFNCVSCNSLKALLMLGNSEDCSKCPNRMLDESGKYCRLKECPSDKPFYEKASGCKSCADSPKFIKKEECEQCPGVRWVEVPDFGTVGIDSYCAPDLPDRVYHGFNRVQMTEKGILVSPLYYRDPYFFTLCSELDGIAVSAEECAHCPNAYMKDGFCFGNNKESK